MAITRCLSCPAARENSIRIPAFRIFGATRRSAPAMARAVCGHPLPRLAQSSALPSTARRRSFAVPDHSPRSPTNAMTNVASCDDSSAVSLPSARLRWYAAMTAPVGRPSPASAAVAQIAKSAILGSRGKRTSRWARSACATASSSAPKIRPADAFTAFRISDSVFRPASGIGCNSTLMQRSIRSPRVAISSMAVRITGRGKSAPSR